MRKKCVALLAAAAIAVGGFLAGGTEARAAEWRSDDYGWWLLEDNGSYAAQTWRQINGAWYYFDASGYMLTGWQFIDGNWYYLYDSGAMASNTWIGNYYVYGNGTMATNTWIGNYYVGSDGAWIPGFGISRWLPGDGGWWYRHADGSYTTSGWEWIGRNWYYFNASGYIVTGWSYIDGSWYYMYDNGVMAANTWVGNYYLDDNGVMATNTWIDGYYVGSDGAWIPGYGNSSQEEEPDISLYPQQVIDLVNEKRASEGLPALIPDPNLMAAANQRAKELELKFSHTRPDGSSYYTVLEEYNLVDWYSDGENIASGQTSPKQVVTSWMNSPGHRGNILNEKYTHIGVGHYLDSHGNDNWVQLFMSTW